jgi:hypothetical protein
LVDGTTAKQAARSFARLEQSVARFRVISVYKLVGLPKLAACWKLA